MNDLLLNELEPFTLVTCSGFVCIGTDHRGKTQKSKTEKLLLPTASFPTEGAYCRSGLFVRSRIMRIETVSLGYQRKRIRKTYINAGKMEQFYCIIDSDEVAPLFVHKDTIVKIHETLTVEEMLTHSNSRFRTAVLKTI